MTPPHPLLLLMGSLMVPMRSLIRAFRHVLPGALWAFIAGSSQSQLCPGALEKLGCLEAKPCVHSHRR